MFHPDVKYFGFVQTHQGRHGWGELDLCNSIIIQKPPTRWCTLIWNEELTSDPKQFACWDYFFQIAIALMGFQIKVTVAMKVQLRNKEFVSSLLRCPPKIKQ